METNNWQPIETMPFDKNCLVVSQHNEIEIRYRPKDRQDMLYPGGSSLAWRTHWMELPTPPKDNSPPKWYDWSLDEGGYANSSIDFELMAAYIAQVIKNDAHMLMSGNVSNTGRLIAAHIVHLFKLVPSTETDIKSIR